MRPSHSAGAPSTNVALPEVLITLLTFAAALLLAPAGKRPAVVGILDPVPADGYLRHLASPFTAPARTPV